MRPFYRWHSSGCLRQAGAVGQVVAQSGTHASGWSTWTHDGVAAMDGALGGGFLCLLSGGTALNMVVYGRTAYRARHQGMKHAG